MDRYFYLSYRLAKGWQRLLEMSSGVGCHSGFLERFNMAGMFSRNAKERSCSGAQGKDWIYSCVGRNDGHSRKNFSPETKSPRKSRH